MLLIIEHHLKYSKRDPVTNKPLVSMHLLVSNVKDTNIFYAKELALLEAQSMGSLTVTYIVQKSVYPADYTGIIGEITEEVIHATMPKPAASSGDGSVPSTSNRRSTQIPFNTNTLPMGGSGGQATPRSYQNQNNSSSGYVQPRSKSLLGETELTSGVRSLSRAPNSVEGQFQYAPPSSGSGIYDPNNQTAMVVCG
jgi:hypothetical protein